MENWLKYGKLGVKHPSSPDPRNVAEADPDLAVVFTKCNEEVSNTYINTTNVHTPKKRKRGDYGSYSPEQRAKMAKYTIDNGPAKAAKHFTKILGRPINESTLRSIKNNT
ncbi:uncharacterized protein LOC117340497 [Pecten maximus]|uniref:uncharacterized protein LOC117340497 n=1 Tax=Pecten maximus TaxID=6579 RepID=UPI001458F117|nr:uncharacterized protein LOC117340497 [Pecten maximus]